MQSVLVLVLVVTVLGLFVFIATETHKKVDKNICTRPDSDFGFFPSMEGIAINGCEDSPDCNYKVENLKEAVDKCHEIECGAFSYNSGSKIMYVVDNDVKQLKASPSQDTYVFQV